MVHKNILKNHQLEQLPAKNVKEITKKELINYYKKYYTPDNIVLAISGRIPKNIDATISKLNNMQITNHKKIRLERTLMYQIKNYNNLVVLKKKLKQTYFGLTFPTCTTYDNNKYVLNLISVILSDGLTSRLEQKLVLKCGLIYHTHIDISLYQDFG